MLRRGLWETAQMLAMFVDQAGIDGLVNGVARATGWLGERMRRLQTGLVSVYALTLFVGLVLLFGYFFILRLVN